MGKFTTPLRVEQREDISHEGRGTWTLIDPLIYDADSGVTYVVPAGFKTDFASVPRIPIIFDAMGDRANLATAVHDWLYTSDASGKHPVPDRDTADKLLKEMALAQGCSEEVAEALYLGVRVGGADHWS